MLIPLIYSITFDLIQVQKIKMYPWKFNSSPPKNDGWKKTFLLGFGNFFSAIIVSFREGSWHRLHTAFTFLDGFFRLHNPMSTFGHQGTGSVHPRHVLRSSALLLALQWRERRKSDDCIGMHWITWWRGKNHIQTMLLQISSNKKPGGLAIWQWGSWTRKNIFRTWPISNVLQLTVDVRTGV